MFKKIAIFHKQHYLMFLTFFWVPLAVHNTLNILGTEIGFWDSLVVSVSISFVIDMLLSRVFDLLKDAEITVKGDI